MPSKTHEIFSDEFFLHIHNKIGELGLQQEVVPCGSASVKIGTKRKEPDRSLTLQSPLLPANRCNEWPTFVIETGYSDSVGKTHKDAQKWLEGSNGAVKFALALKVAPNTGNIRITSWYGGGPVRVKRKADIFITKSKKSTPVLPQGPSSFSVPFESIFLRKVRSDIGEEDFLFSWKDLRYICKTIWINCYGDTPDVIMDHFHETRTNLQTRIYIGSPISLLMGEIRSVGRYIADDNILDGDHRERFEHAIAAWDNFSQQTGVPVPPEFVRQDFENVQGYPN